MKFDVEKEDGKRILSYNAMKTGCFCTKYVTLGCRFPISNPTGGFNNRISQAVKKSTGLVVYFWGTLYMSNMSRDM